MFLSLSHHIQSKHMHKSSLSPQVWFFNVALYTEAYKSMWSPIALYYTLAMWSPFPCTTYWQCDLQPGNACYVLLLHNLITHSCFRGSVTSSFTNKTECIIICAPGSSFTHIVIIVKDQYNQCVYYIIISYISYNIIVQVSLRLNWNSRRRP